MAAFFLVCVFLASTYEFSHLEESSGPMELASVAGSVADLVTPSTEPRPRPNSAPPISSSVQKEIEGLFLEVRENTNGREKALRKLRRVLQRAFEGQEDCWSCEGTVYFDKYDEIAGAGQARKPLSLREWIEGGDEAFEEHNLNEARKFYSQALSILDERSFQDESPMDPQIVEKLRNRCSQIECR